MLPAQSSGSHHRTLEGQAARAPRTHREQRGCHRPGCSSRGDRAGDSAWTSSNLGQESQAWLVTTGTQLPQGPQSHMVSRDRLKPGHQALGPALPPTMASGTSGNFPKPRFPSVHRGTTLLRHKAPEDKLGDTKALCLWLRGPWCHLSQGFPHGSSANVGPT